MLEVARCSVCGFVYDPRLGLPEAGIPPGTPWVDVPESWVCPDCGMPKSAFKMTPDTRHGLDY